MPQTLLLLLLGRNGLVKTQLLIRSLSSASVLALLTAFVAALVPAHAEVVEDSTITDPVLQVGADEFSRNLSWMSESSDGGEVRWVKVSELEGEELPEDADSVETSDSGRSTDLKRHYNHASMTGLEAGTEYAYQVGSEEDGFTSVETFTTGTPGGDSEFLVFGDPQVGSGSGEPDDATGWARTLSSGLTTAEAPRFFYSLGDQVNSAGDQDEYAQYLAPEATPTVPQATTIGSHDVGSKSYEQHFNRPNVSQDHGGDGLITSGGDYWFIDSGVLFININSNNLDTDEHAEFIDEVVAEHGDEARWKVLGFHHSIYSTATHNDDLDVKKLRKAIPPVAARNDIDLVVSGHDHIYNRTFLMDSEGQPVEGSDGGREQEKDEGQTLYLTLTSSSGSKFYDYVPGLDWEAKSVHNDVPAFTRMRVSDDALRATTYEVPSGADGQVSAQAASEQIDDVELTRAGDEDPDPGANAEADADGAEADSTGAEADAGSEGAEGGTDAGSEANAAEADTDTGSEADSDAGARADAGADGTEADSGGTEATADESAEAGAGEEAGSDGGEGDPGAERSPTLPERSPTRTPTTPVPVAQTRSAATCPGPAVRWDCRSPSAPPPFSSVPDWCSSPDVAVAPAVTEPSARRASDTRSVGIDTSSAGNDHHRACGMIEDSAGDGAKQRRLHGSATACAQHRELGTAGGLDDRRLRIAHRHRGGDRQLGELSLQPLGLRAQGSLKLLLATPGDLGAEFEVGVPVQPFLARGKHADDLEPGAPKRGLLGRGEHRDPAGLRAVHGHSDGTGLLPCSRRVFLGA